LNQPTDQPTGTLVKRIRRRLWVVILCALVGGAFAYHHASAKSQKFQATAQLLFGANVSVSTELGLPSSSSNGSATQLATNAGLVALPVISTLTQQALGSHVPPGGVNVNAQAVGATNLVEVLAQSATPSGAMQVANTYAQQFVQYTQQQQKQEFSQAIAQIRRAIAARQARGAGGGVLGTTLANLENVVAVNPVGVSVAQLATSASLVGRKTKTKAIEGLVLGGIVGIIIALLLDWFDPKLRDLTEDGFQGLRVITLKDLPKQARVEAATAITRRLLSEAARHGDIPSELIAVTSTGKQQDVQSARNLAAVLAQTAAANGLNACIVRVTSSADPSDATDADSRSLGELARTKLTEGVEAVDVPPQALLHSAAMRDLEAELRDSYRLIVVFDERPSAFSALAQLVRSADLTVLVATLGRTRRRDAIIAARALVEMTPANAALVAFPAGFRAALQKGLALQPAS
jgi:capsular polysaccharide biosynthesis protein